MRFLAWLVLLAAWTAQAADLRHFSLSPAGRFVAGQQPDGSIWIAEASSSAKQALPGKGNGAAEFSWSLNDKIVYVAQNGSISAFSLESKRRFKALHGGWSGSQVEVAPNGRSFAYIRDNTLRLSSSSNPLIPAAGDNLLIGTADPVYAAEFDVNRHYWWSPDSTSIAYVETEFSDANHYVVPGGKLPVFRLKTFDVSTGQTRLINESSDAWPYLMRVAWHPDSRRVFFYRMNRLQTVAELCTFEAGTITTVLTEKDLYWANAPETPVFVNGGARVVVSSERSGGRHVYLYELNGHLVGDLTPKDLEVYKLYPMHDAAHVYVYGSSGTHQEQHLFRLSLDGAPAHRITQEAGWHDVILEATTNAYLDDYSSTLKPPSLHWHGANGAQRELVPSANGKPVANEFFTIKTHDNVDLPARLFKPDDFDPKKKYPLILFTFSAPRGRVVKDAWDGWQMAWNRHIVRQGFLVLAVDVRGSGGYGHLFEEYIHYRFGAQETADLREVVSYLQLQSYVDRERLGIWGCDRGAATVVHAMWQFPGGFKAGFADAPIADWRKFNAYFAERYLGLPAQRPNEYEESTALHDARNMTGTLMTVAAADDLQVAALKNAMSHLRKNPEVATRFHAATLPDDVSQLMAIMTEFFRSTL